MYMKPEILFLDDLHEGVYAYSGAAQPSRTFTPQNGIVFYTSVVPNADGSYGIYVRAEDNNNSTANYHMSSIAITFDRAVTRQDSSFSVMGAGVNTLLVQFSGSLPSKFSTDTLAVTVTADGEPAITDTKLMNHG
ncbi:MAG: hypothetical protein IJ225_02560 [Solobacterium sp.]|nr:hypothetical protein [Solobacterium sp.]